MKRYELFLATLYGIFMVAFAPSTAHAYIDPGVGLLVFQGVIASAVGGLFFARRMIAQTMRALFGKRAPASETKPE